MKQGWIKLHRQILESDIWDDEEHEPFDRRSAWIDLLLLANHKDKQTVFDGKPITVKRGQKVTSVRKLSERWRWSVNRTYRYLKLLEELNMIERQSDNRRTLLTIVKYEVFQDSENTNEYTDRTLTDTQIEHSRNTNKNIKNDKNIKNNNKAIFFPDNEELNQSFLDYIEMRKKIKKPMSDRAITLALNKLEVLSGGNAEKAIRILNQSIFGSWQGLYELKNESVTQKTPQYKTFSHTDELSELEKELLAN